MASMQGLYRDRWRFILHVLSCAPQSRRELERAFNKKLGSTAVFESTFQFLLEDGRTMKTGTKHRAPYGITESGRKMLEGLS